MLERRVSARMLSIRTSRKMGTVDGGGECGPGQWVCMGLWPTNPRVYVQWECGCTHSTPVGN